MIKLFRLIHKMYKIKTCTAIRWLNCGAIQRDVDDRIRKLEVEKKAVDEELEDLKTLRRYIKEWG
jgi:hypothetical protein